MRILDAARRGLKSMSSRHGGSTGWGWPTYTSAGLDWNREAGVRYDNSIVFSAIQFAIDAMLEVPVYVRRAKADGSYEEVPGHPITQLLSDPNDWYGWNSLLSGWVISELAGPGMSYTFKHRSGAGKVVALEYLPHFNCFPYWAPGSKNFIDAYRLTLMGGMQAIPVRDVLAQRYGPLNPLRPQVSIGPLEAALLEVVTDKQAANYTAALLKNVGVTPHLISPNWKDADGREVVLDGPQIEQVKAAFEEKITGDNRGRPLIAPFPLKVDDLSFSPSDMNLEAIRNISEERVCAVLRIPPQVLHLGTGLENQNNRASAEAAAVAAARSFTKPFMRRKGMELTRDLVPELGQPGEEVCFRWEHIEALQEDKGEEAKRDSTACGGPWETVNEVRKRRGLEPIEGGDELRSGRQGPDEQDEDKQDDGNRRDPGRHRRK